MQGDKPTLIAYTVKDPRGVGQKGIWTRIGAAWPHENGSGSDAAKFHTSDVGKADIAT